MYSGTLINRKKNKTIITHKTTRTFNFKIKQEKQNKKKSKKKRQNLFIQLQK